MATSYIIGSVTKSELENLKRRGYVLCTPPDELVEESRVGITAVQILMDADVMDLLKDAPPDQVDIPMGHDERQGFMVEAALELAETFYCGNLKDLVEHLDRLPRHMAYAVLARTLSLELEKQGHHHDLARYLRETA